MNRRRFLFGLGVVMGAVVLHVPILGPKVQVKWAATPSAAGYAINNGTGLVGVNLEAPSKMLVALDKIWSQDAVVPDRIIMSEGEYRKIVRWKHIKTVRAGFMEGLNRAN